ncbi:MAG: tetratricopeptide repeat protein [Bacteroidales bacterium]|nr:tetratricopeptide repeat protein [Bacteroidales bacterium]MBN2698784.1 tetratricopeptide repeat protein [Bacteroidales bacterium]
MRKQSTKYGLCLFWFIVLLTSCSVEKNTVTTRNYHNLTSHYNIYYNGHESFNKGVKRAREAFRNDYTQLLPIFYYVDESVHSAVQSDMKRAIDKATKVITLHSITAKPKVRAGDQSPQQKAFYEKREYNKWVDDSYMLMGKAYMYQGEFFLAIETFKHVMVTFPDEDVRFLALIWLARANIMIDELKEAERLIIALSDAPELPENYLLELYLTKADYSIKTENYNAAAENLKLALTMKPEKEQKIRYTFIIAQLYEELGEKEMAMSYYRNVTQLNPPYEMAFNAKVSMAEVFDSGTSDSGEIKKLLQKMLKDSKNQEYKDQIYFAMGNISQEEGDMEKAIEYYTLSVSSSVRNNHQKGESALTLASIYYDEPDYLLSAAYYDSAVNLLKSDYPNYNVLSSRSRSLSELVTNINMFELEDSVQELAALPEAERLAVIDGIIEKVKEQEVEERLAQQQTIQDMQYNRGMYNTSNAFQQNTQSQGGKWYFYNLNAKSYGQPEFRMKWGDRELVDNWRRSNRQSVSSLMEGIGTPSDTTGGAAGKVLDNKSREFYLAAIPLTDSAMEQSNGRLETALFNMGQIYKNDLLDYNESIAAFEELINRYPDGSYTANAYYYLYELYNSIQKGERASQYRELLAEEFPESHYSKLLSNPNYIKELEEEEAAVYRLYERIYDDYSSERHPAVIEGVESALVEFEGDPLIPKFMYIKALSIGAVEGKEAMKSALDTLIALHPGTEESLQAQELIDYMYVAFPVIKEAEEAREAEEIYGLYPESGHYLVISLLAGENINQVNFDLLNFNLDYFNQYDLTIEKIEFDAKNNLLKTGPFINQLGAERYRNTIEENMQVILGDVPENRYSIFIISEENYNVMLQKKGLNSYQLFYENFYLNSE